MEGKTPLHLVQNKSFLERFERITHQYTLLFPPPPCPSFPFLSYFKMLSETLLRIIS